MDFSTRLNEAVSVSSSASCVSSAAGTGSAAGGGGSFRTIWGIFRSLGKTGAAVPPPAAPLALAQQPAAQKAASDVCAQKYACTAFCHVSLDTVPVLMLWARSPQRRESGHVNENLLRYRRYALDLVSLGAASIADAFDTLHYVILFQTGSIQTFVVGLPSSQLNCQGWACNVGQL